MVASEGDTFSANTEAAVREFQQRRGLRVDGVCGSQTWNALVEAGYRLGDRLLYFREPMLRGDDIVDLQRQLAALGFLAGRVDGIFGPESHAAVTAFQRNAGIVEDGTVGLATITSLRRLRSRGPASDPAALRETMRMREASVRLSDRHIAVGEAGGIAPLARETQRVLTGYGATVTLLAHPDAAVLAAQANTAGADLYLGLGLGRAGAGCGAAYWGAHEFESPAGRRLATFVLEELSSSGVGVDGGPRAMNTPALRETRMPAVALELGPARAVVERSHEIGAAIGRAVARWSLNPCEPGA